MQDIKPLRMGIRLKLFILVFVSFSLLIAIILWRIGVQSQTTARESIERSLEQSSTIVAAKNQIRFDSIAETAISLSRDGRVLPLVYDGAAETLQDLTLEFKRALDFNSMLVLNASGIILARSDRPEAMGMSVAGKSPLFDQALQGKMSQGFIASQGRLLQIVAAPVFDNVAHDMVRGVIAIAYELSPLIAQEIGTLSQSETSFYIFEHNQQREIDHVSSTYSTRPNLDAALASYFAEHPNLWRSVIDMQGSSNTVILNLNDEIFHAVIHPLARSGGGNLGFILTFRSETELLKPFIEIQRQVLYTGLLCIFIASILALFMAQRITKPIIQLVRITKKIQNGIYPDNNDATRKDEIGILHKALLRMGQSIKEKAELETYLAQLADDIADNDLFETVDVNALTDEMSANVQHTLLTIKGNIKGENIDSTEIIAFEPTPTADKNRMHLREGNMINQRYQLIKRLGRGASGEVYLATDTELHEPVAIKILYAEYCSNELATMFKEEIRLARKITHRNILRTFDFGSSDDISYITMEYVPGFDLGKLIDRKGPLQINIAIIMAKQICSALQAAHELGIIHRDLKPENMMINKHGILKIMDFGLAMQINNKISADGSNENPQETTVAGTPKYMAPEQFIAGELDQRTDIYAVGVIIFTILTGRTPFNAKDFNSLAIQHSQEAPPALLSILKDAPRALETIINKAMAKDKEDRYQEIAELLAALNDI